VEALERKLDFYKNIIEESGNLNVIEDSREREELLEKTVQQINSVNEKEDKQTDYLDNTRKKEGIYWVTDGAAKFTAKTDENSRFYNVGDTVRVLAIKGDLGNCYISGKYSQNTDNDPLTYISPSETVVSMTDNLVQGKFDTWGIVANESDIKDQDKCLWSISLNSSDFKDLQVNSIYNTLVLKADFKCLLANYRMKTGSYGLRLRLVQKATNDNTYPVVQEVELDSSAMFGNPYSFLVYSTQEATFDISNIGTIDAISLYLY
jgi:hypothetical protein